MHNNDYARSIEFISRFFGVSDDAVELRACDNVRSGRAESLITRSGPEMRDFCQRKDIVGTSTYFGVCKRQIDAPRGSKEFVTSAPALWVDIDCVKQGLGSQEVIQTLEFLAMPPSVIVNSGGGLHAYWMLEEAVDVSPSSPMRDVAEAALRQLVYILAGDIQCAEVARIMRLPGTMNSKEATMALYDGEPAICTVLSDNGRVWDFEALCEWLSELRPLLQGKAQPARPVKEDDPFVAYSKEAGFEPAIDIEAELAAMEYGAEGRESVHGTQLRVSMSMAARDYDDDEIVAVILAATERVAPADEKWNWGREEKKIRGMLRTGRKKVADRRESAPPRSLPQTNGNTVLKLVPANDPDDEPASKPAKAPKESKSQTVGVGRAAIGVWQDRHGPVMHALGTTYVYEEGVWLEWDDRLAQQLRAIIQEACASLRLEPKTSLLNAAKAYFMDRPEMIRRNVKFDEHALLVAADACLDLKTFEIVPHSPEHYATKKVAATLDGPRDCPALHDFLKNAFIDNAEGEGIIMMLQEWFGAAIVSRQLKSRDMMKGLLVHGPSRSGKTQLSELARYLLGHEHVLGARMSDLEDRFGREPLIGKRGWIADDAIGEAEYLDAETYKVIITGEPTSAKRKGGKNWEGRFGIPVMLTANNKPRIRDQSEATYNRSLFVSMTNVRPKDASEPEGYSSISVKIGTEELTGLLWWAIEGWQRLSQRGTFSEPSSIRRANKTLQDENNHTGAWFAQCVERNSTYRVARADLLVSFQGWALLEHDNEDGWKPKTITRRIREMLSGNEEPIVNGVRYIAGISLNQEGLAAWDRWKDNNYGKSIGTVAHSSEVNRVHSGGADSSPSKKALF